MSTSVKPEQERENLYQAKNTGLRKFNYLKATIPYYLITVSSIMTVNRMTTKRPAHRHRASHGNLAALQVRAGLRKGPWRRSDKVSERAPVRAPAVTRVVKSDV